MALLLFCRCSQLCRGKDRKTCFVLSQVKDGVITQVWVDENGNATTNGGGEEGSTADGTSTGQQGLVRSPDEI